MRLRMIVFMIFFLFVGNAFAQSSSFVAVGAQFGSVIEGNSGQSQSIGGFTEGNLSGKLGLRLDAYGLGSLEYSPKAGTTTPYEIKLRPEARVFAPIPVIQPFVGGGVQYNFFHSDQYSKAGLNYTGTAGVEIAKDYTLRATRLFTDRTRLNDNRLEGFRYGLDVTHNFSGENWGIRFSAEYLRFKYRQVRLIGYDHYTDNQVTFRLGVARRTK